ncbi:hypothetical protein VTJ83DRAFT_5572 [Remersonia thermophila]|uniref:glucan endo-1,3-beta-D-glucosidase n=1 Tax=Remersonia thermophila TaxID=72144 RepID=A0ABR4D802_9PEZI
MWSLAVMLLTSLKVAAPFALNHSQETFDQPRVITSVGPSETAQILVDKKIPASGFIHSELGTLGHATIPPLLTSPIPEPKSLLPAQRVVVNLQLHPPPPSMASPAQDIFSVPISTDPPPGNIQKRQDHPVPRKGISRDGPIQTNKFYAGFFLANQTSPSFLHPYSVAWPRGQGASGTFGLAISHIEAHQRVLGPPKPHTGAASYFINPIGIQSVCLSAAELGGATELTTESPTDFSVQVSLRPSPGARPAVRFPLVQGAGFITALYEGSRPLVQSGVFFRSLTRVSAAPKAGVVKYRLLLEDGTTWFLYARHTSGSPLDLEVVNNGLARAKQPFSGTIQVAKAPIDPGGAERVYDRACGTYATGVKLSGSVDKSRGRYTFSFEKKGLGGDLVMFALPHHRASFDAPTRERMTGLRLQTTTKGIAVAVVADSWIMVEPDLPVGIGFLPWLPQKGTVSAISDKTRAAIRAVAQREISQNILDQTDQDSMYFSGKALAKFACLVLAIKELLKDAGLAQAGLAQLKTAFARFKDNKQKFPLVYEGAWGGVVSSALYATGDPFRDFGNAHYNDHHFHWGYFIYTAAVIGRLDPSWIPGNKAYVNMLARDVANPSRRDTHFPLWRAFDWFHGHSWAHGLFDALDSKNQESSSEDTMHTYALKLWGSVTGDANLEARSNLMLAVQARSFDSYYYYRNGNIVEPPQFVGNRVAGILFENKIDHTTFFGANIEYIQGIHMLPLLPHTPYARRPVFVREEWDTYFSGGRAEAINSGWKGILFGNYATIDPRAAYNFFSRPGFNPAWLDGGASLTWYLCYSAALAGL